ncbi:fatty acid--CoA ligase family protein [Virgibacillus xinjiangensis]|uniref:Fatty acid--CoA ligase family protein n=1 Tax=Virgibacillus xinjiangensis TaxID=393090 RepID=A0ABV7CWD2_9BACI
MNITEQLAVTAQSQPEKTAYVFEDKQTSYMELERSVQKFASSLTGMGLKKGDHIALVVGNSPYYVIGLYGALRLGAVVIPINPLYMANEMNYILNDGDVKAVITMDVLLEKFAAIHEQLPGVRNYISCDSGAGSSSLEDHILGPKLHSFTDLVQAGSPGWNPAEWKDDETAIILYTSGTTGKPKGAMLTHRNIYSNAKDVADYLAINGEDRVIAALPMFHVFCLTVALNAPLMNGGTVLILPKFSPSEVFRIAKDHQATVFAGVPTMYNYLLQSGESQGEFANIRLCISGGAAMPVSLLEAFEETFDVQISEGYGLSEASPVTCFNPLDRPRKAGSIGQSILNVENKVVDEFGEELPIGEVGELAVTGPNVMKGYYNLPDETASALKDGWLYTGDMARMDEEGYFYIVDRKKELILVGGYNVYPREVEEVLYAHPNVSEAAVIGVPHPEAGEAVMAFVVSDDSSVTADELAGYCRQHLIGYKVPSEIEFLDELPKNTTGKILRKNLRDQVKQ